MPLCLREKNKRYFESETLLKSRQRIQEHVSSCQIGQCFLHANISLVRLITHYSCSIYYHSVV